MNSTSAQATDFQDLFDRYQKATGIERESLDRELREYLDPCIYIDTASVGSERTFRLERTVREGDDFVVHYSDASGSHFKIPLGKAVRLVEGPHARYAPLRPLAPAVRHDLL